MNITLRKTAATIEEYCETQSAKEETETIEQLLRMVL